MLPCPFVHEIVNHKVSIGGDHKGAQGHERLVLSVSTNITASSPKFLSETSPIPTCPKSYIARVCISEKAGNTMLSYPYVHEIVKHGPSKGEGDHKEAQGHKRLLLSVAMNISSRSRRFLNEASQPACPKGQVPLVSINGLHQLHLFIFFLALCHVFFSVMTMTLGRAKIRGWKEWERETTSADYEFSNDPARFRLTHETSFVRQHTSFWNKLPASFYMIILLVGTKLQAIISMMAIEVQERHAVIQGIPLVQVSDHHFWFGRPHFILFLIHFTLFQYAFGLDSCFNSNPRLIFARLCLGAIVQFLCSYITLPLYALVSQMGSQMKKSIFDEETSKALKKWHQAAKKKNAKESKNLPAARSPETSPKGSAATTGMKQLHHSDSNGPTMAASAYRDSGTETEMQPPASIHASLPSSNHRLDLLTGLPE